MQQHAILPAFAFSLLAACGGGGEEATVATLVPYTPQTATVQAQESDTASKPNWAQVLPLRLSQTSSRDGSSLIRYQNIANIEYLYNTNTSTFDRIDLSIDGQVVRLTVNPANSRQYSGSHNGILYRLIFCTLLTPLMHFQTWNMSQSCCSSLPMTPRIPPTQIALP